MRVATTIAEARAARASLGAVGLVPTMGYLHAGHLSLVALAKAQCDAVAVSIFVNPTQFAPHEDLARYPRDLPRDLDLLRQAGADLVFTPTADEIYPPGFATRIDPGPVATPLEGAVRPGHFSGVATIVAKLFNIVQPTRAYFGQKDAQQSAVVRRIVSDLDFPLDIVVVPTVREPDGLAMSSRNAYLDRAQRAIAPILLGALMRASRLHAAGERDADTLRQAMRDTLATAPELAVDYVSLADPETLDELQRVDAGALASLAARLGQTRLIDNVILGAAG